MQFGVAKKKLEELKKDNEFAQRVEKELAWNIVSENLLAVYRKLMPDKLPIKTKVSSTV